MTKLQFIINSTGSILLSGVNYFLGGFDSSIKALLIVILIDYITGICKAIINKNVSSIIGLKGIIKKVGYLLIVGLAGILDKIMGNTMAIRNLVIYFFVANEGISIVENWGGMGLPLPKKLIAVLQDLKNKEEIKS